MTFSAATDEAQKESFFFQKPRYNHQLNGILLTSYLKFHWWILVKLLYMQAVTYHLEALSCV